MRELDETFLQECLSELRDGETVTVRVGVRFRQKVRDALADLGATREELDKRGPEVMGHHCHALGCKAACPPRWLMFRACWSKVPAAIQFEVSATVGQRGRVVDVSWAPWWRAQAKAIAHVAHLRDPNEARRDAYLARAMAFADTLETR